MTILQPAYLWFLLLALIPIILYILFRRRRNEVQWGATYVLRLALASGRRQTLWKQLLVIALRTLLLALLIVAFARPFMERTPDELGEDLPHGLGTLHRVVLVDNSLSMQARHGLGTRFDAARAATARLLATLRDGDTAQLVPLCPEDEDAGPALSEIPVPINRDAAMSRAAELELRASSLDLAAALRTAVDAFRAGAANNRQLIIITDLSRSDHPRLDDYEIFGRMLADLDVRVAILNLGDRGQLNLAVERATAGTERFLTGQPTNVYVDIVNFSDIPSEEANLRFFVDSELRGESPVILAAGQRRTFTFPVELTAGEHILDVRLTDDAYPADNRVERFVYGEQITRLLLVLPADVDAQGFDAPGIFLQRALAAAGESPYRFQVETLRSDMLTVGSFANRDAVIICEPQALNAGVRAALAGFIRQGGGLLLTAGQHTQPETLARDYAGLAPATLERPFRPEFDEERYQQIQSTEVDLPLLREFATARNGDLARARVYNHWQTSLADDAAALLSLNNGDPLLLERRYGQGTILLWATSAGGAWTSLPVRQAYVPFLYRLVTRAASFGRAARNLDAGSPLIAEVTTSDDLAFLTTPDAELLEIPIQQGADARFVRLDDADQPGTWELRDRAGEILAGFSIAMPLAESDLRLLEPDDLERLTSHLGARVADQPAALAEALWRDGDGREQAAWLLAAVVALFLLDALATRYFFA